MKKYISLSLTAIALLLFSTISFAQTMERLNLGILTSFAAYNGAGDITNTGGTVNGDAGANTGVAIGFDNPQFLHNIYSKDAATQQAQFDLLRLYIHLNSLFVDFPNAIDPSLGSQHAAAFTNETLVPGVYYIPSAASIGPGLILDGGPNDKFVFKINGAVTTTGVANITLTGGVKSANVFWLANGALTIAADATIVGTLFSKGGAVGLGAGVNLEGRMFSAAGAITIGVGATATPPADESTIDVFCESTCDASPLVDVLGSVKNFALFARDGATGNTGISGVSGDIGSDTSINGYSGGIHIGDEVLDTTIIDQAATDLGIAYDALLALEPTHSDTNVGRAPEDHLIIHTAAFKNETVLPGVYQITTAGSAGGNVILDAQGDPDAIFVFRFGGAFDAEGNTKMILQNGAKRCNVFWIGGAGVPAGAVNIGASSEVSGYFMANGGASNSGAGVFLGGGQYSLAGAVNTNAATIYSNPDCVTSTVLASSAACGLVKVSSVGSDGAEGDTITYTFKVTNTGPDPLTNIVVTDPMTLDGLVFTSGNTIANLAVGEVNETITGTYVIKAADIDAGNVINQALAEGQSTVLDEDTGEIVEVADFSGTANNNDQPTVTLVPNQAPNSAIALVKTSVVNGTGANGAGVAGDTITYTFEVTNTGTTLLANIVVTDPKLDSIAGNPIRTLQPTLSRSEITGTYTITEADVIAGSVTNTATVTAQDPAKEDVTDTSGTTKDNDDATVTSIEAPDPAIALVKTANVGGTGAVGDVITYSFAVTNTGNVTLTDIVVTDPNTGVTIAGSPIASLAPGASDSTVTATYTITQADVDTGSVTNSATATDANGVTDISGTANDNDTPTVTSTEAAAATIALVKTASVGGAGAVGDVITYTFAVTNTGNVTLTDIVVTDPNTGVTIAGSPIVSLAPGASDSTVTATYTITQADIDTGSVTNSATATDANGVTDISGTANDNDTPTVTSTEAAAAAIALVKTASVGGTGAVGDVITYTFTVENTGNATLTNAVVTDVKLDSITGSPIASLAPG
ncbi:MAG: putative repeat protein (TIGR01451 family), partial [Arenicella sp.]